MFPPQRPVMLSKGRGGKILFLLVYILLAMTFFLTHLLENITELTFSSAVDVAVNGF